MRYKKLTRNEALHLKASLRAIRSQLEDLMVEWQYHALQQQKVEDTLCALLEAHGLKPSIDPECGGIDGADYADKLHINWLLGLRLWGHAEWDLTGVDFQNPEEAREWLRQ